MKRRRVGISKPCGKCGALPPHSCPPVLKLPHGYTRTKNRDNRWVTMFDCPRCGYRQAELTEPSSKGVLNYHCRTCNKIRAVRLSEYEPPYVAPLTDAQRILKDNPTATPPGWR